MAMVSAAALLHGPSPPYDGENAHTLFVQIYSMLCNLTACCIVIYKRETYDIYYVLIVSRIVRLV